MVHFFLFFLNTLCRAHVRPTVSDAVAPPGIAGHQNDKGAHFSRRNRASAATSARSKIHHTPGERFEFIKKVIEKAMQSKDFQSCHTPKEAQIWSHAGSRRVLIG